MSQTKRERIERVPESSQTKKEGDFKLGEGSQIKLERADVIGEADRAASSDEPPERKTFQTGVWLGSLKKNKAKTKQEYVDIDGEHIPRASWTPGGASIVAPDARGSASSSDRPRNGRVFPNTSPNFKLFRKSDAQRTPTNGSRIILQTTPWAQTTRAARPDAFSSQNLDGDSQSQLP